MKFSRLLTFAVVALAMSACDSVTNTPDGKVPAQYLTAAQTVMGTYNGMFNHDAGSFTLQLNGDMPMMTYTDYAGHDLIPGCGTAIGKLVSFATSDANNGELTQAVFEFSPGHCPIEGRALSLQFNTDPVTKHITVDASILERTYTVYDPGTPVCEVDAHGHTFCYTTGGGYHTEYQYMNGAFHKI